MKTAVSNWASSMIEPAVAEANCKRRSWRRNAAYLFGGSRSLLSIACALILSCQSAFAGQVLFAPDGGATTGSIETALPLEKLGSVTLPRGRIVIHGDTVSVSVIPEWQFDRQVVLSGKVLDTRIAQGAGHRQIDGVAFFTGGQWLKYFDDPAAVETVITDKEAISGRIAGVTDSAIVINRPLGTQIEIPLQSVLRLQSPRSFTFAIPLPIATAIPTPPAPVSIYADRIALNPPRHVFHMKALKAQVAEISNDGDLPTRKLVFMGTALTLAELGQIAPLIVLPTGTTHLRHQMLRREAASLATFGVIP